MEGGGPGDTPRMLVWAHQLSQDTKPRTKNCPWKSPSAQPPVYQWRQNWSGIKPGIKNEGTHRSNGRIPDLIRSDSLRYLFHFDFDVERQCTVLTSKCSVPWTLHCSHTQREIMTCDVQISFLLQCYSAERERNVEKKGNGGGSL